MRGFVISDFSWFVRGDSHYDNPSYAGVFSFVRDYGEPFPLLAFRSVLAYYNI